jgi:hypothetical protein
VREDVGERAVAIVRREGTIGPHALRAALEDEGRPLGYLPFVNLMTRLIRERRVCFEEGVYYTRR